MFGWTSLRRSQSQSVSVTFTLILDFRAVLPHISGAASSLALDFSHFGVPRNFFSAFIFWNRQHHRGKRTLHDSVVWRKLLSNTWNILSKLLMTVSQRYLIPFYLKKKLTFFSLILTIGGMDGVVANLPQLLTPLFRLQFRNHLRAHGSITTSKKKISC